jgi:hypothetical protein
MKVASLSEEASIGLAIRKDDFLSWFSSSDATVTL